MSAPYRFTRHGRSCRAILALAVVYGVLGLLLIVFDAAPWLIGAVALFTLPALWDLWRNPAAGIVLSDENLEWFTGRLDGNVPLAEIDRIRMDTRWDLSVRVTILTRDGKSLRLPPEALPPHRRMAAELTLRNLHIERHHFTVF